MIYELSFRDKNHGGAVVPGHMTRGHTHELRAEQAVVFLLHGFNVDRDDGRERLHALAVELEKSFADRGRSVGLVVTLWPGDSPLGPAAYSFQKPDADDTAHFLARYIREELGEGVPLSFVAHSMGSRVALETIQRLLPTDHVIDQVCLFAPAVDNTSLACHQVYREAALRAARVAVLSSVEDKVLWLAYPAGDLLQSFVFHDTAGFALGLNGPRPCSREGLEVPALVLSTPIPKDRRADHSDYLPGEPANPQQRSAMSYAAEVLLDDPLPVYPDAQKP